MNILIAGASGFIGTILANHLSKKHKITVLGRKLKKLESIFSSNISQLTWENLKLHDAKQYDLIINLSGSNIGAKRWNSTVKKELVESRTKTNQYLIAWLVDHNAKPRFFCANAIGIYGAQDISVDSYDEESFLPQSSDDFLQHIGLVWEQSLEDAINTGIPVTTLRFGVVLKQGEGMLKKLEFPFRLGLGSIVGSGHQVLSWIYYKDLLSALDFLIEHPKIIGAVNITSPYPVTQQEFAQLLAKALNRPLFLKVPGFVIRILFGEMGEYLLLKGQRVLPKRLNEIGFKFSYPKIEDTLIEEYHTVTTPQNQ